MDSASAGRSLTVRLVLGKKLRDLREAAGIDSGQLAKLKLGSQSTTSRMETGRAPVAPHKVVALCRLYGVDQATTDELESLAFRSSEDSILDDYSDVIPRWFSIYVQLESLASRISTWQPTVLPGLLQTTDYARAVFARFRPALDPRAIERSVSIREERQRVVFATRPSPQIRAVLDAGVIARQMGSPAIATTQLEYLRALSAAGRVAIRVLPWSAGAHAALEGPFTVLEFDNSALTDVVYAESAAGAKYIDKARELPRFREKLESVIELSVPLEEYTP